MSAPDQKYAVHIQRTSSTTTTGTLLASSEDKARELVGINDLNDQVIDVQHSKEVSVQLMEVL